MAVDPQALAALMMQATGPGQLPAAPPPPQMPLPPLPEQPVAVPVGAPLPPPGPAQMGAPLQPEVMVDAQGTPVPEMPLPPGMSMPEQEPEEPPSMIPVPMKQELARMLNERKLLVAQAIVQAYGQPEGTVSVDDTQLLKLWRYRMPEIDVNKLRAEGVAEGRIVDMVYPLRRGMLSAGHYTWKEKLSFAKRMAQLDRETNEAHLGDIAYDEAKVPLKV